jgi:hypothetical protein
MGCEVHVSPQGGLLSVCVPAREPQAPDERESSNQEVHREAWREQGHYHSSPCSASFLTTRASRPDSSRPSLLRLPSAPHSSPRLGAFPQSQWASQASLPPVHDDGPKAPTGPFACHGPCRQRQYVWHPLIVTGLRPRRQAQDEAVGAGQGGLYDRTEVPGARAGEP